MMEDPDEKSIKKDQISLRTSTPPMMDSSVVWFIFNSVLAKRINVFAAVSSPFVKITLFLPSVVTLGVT